MQKLIIDTDPGIDDALALLLALAAKDELDVTAITTVNGQCGRRPGDRECIPDPGCSRKKRYPCIQGKRKTADAGERQL